ncbi:hypothetical protein EJ02DRAFT_451870 [Clathrospora elynae]|uniref:Uncharacterized protein n=1 Tax=Clathrospora elynae TaxID=706981 RepID=A0A6A5T2S3_9PLEO|nr:hypothetical protein EJ02DRAFT_451870 [Clathrospora elynae]
MPSTSSNSPRSTHCPRTPTATSTQANGRFSDTFAIFNGDDNSQCGGFECSGFGGFDSPCSDTGNNCGAALSGGSLWRDGDDHPKGKIAKRVVGVVKPNVAGLWDVAEKKHHHFNIGNGVPTEVIATLMEAAKNNVQYKDLDQSVKAFEISN